MKSAHKLEAALAIFILLSVAAYFIITGLQNAAHKPPASESANVGENSTVSRERVVASTTSAPNVQTTAREAASSAGEAGTESGPSLVDLISTTTSTTTTTTSTTTSTTTTAEPVTEPTTTPSQPPTTTSSASPSSELAGSTEGPPSSTPDSAINISTQEVVTTTSSPPIETTPDLPSGNFSTTVHDLQPPLDLSPEESERWNQFKVKYGKSYPGREEEEKRQAKFISNLRFINTFNRQSRALFTLDVNHFADLSSDEVNNLFIGPQRKWAQQMPQLPSMRILPDSELPAQEVTRAVDWRNLTTDGVVNQGNCKDSAIFAIVASLESTLNAAGGPKTKLSEQQIIDCVAYNAPPGWPPVCSGLLPMEDVYELLQNNTVTFANARDYDGFKRAQMAGRAPPRECVLPPQTMPDMRPRLGSYVPVPRDNIDEALLNSSPLVVALDASQPTFHFYKSGIYHDMGCSTDSYNYHALLVAHSPAVEGPEPQPAAYTIRASLGHEWGELGHMRLLRDSQRNKCLPQNLAIYPNIALS